MAVNESISQKARRKFLDQDTSNIEVLSGILTVMASVWALVMQAYCHNELFYICSAVSIIQILAAYPIDNLRLRHWTNYLLGCVCVMVSLSIYHEHPANEGVGGYLGAALISYYCSFVTRMKIIGSNE